MYAHVHPHVYGMCILMCTGLCTLMCTACMRRYERVQSSLEADLAYLLAKRKADTWEPVLPRAAVEATWNWTRQVPSFQV